MNRRTAHLVFNIIMCILGAGVLLGVTRCVFSEVRGERSSEVRGERLEVREPSGVTSGVASVGRDAPWSILKQSGDVKQSGDGGDEGELTHAAVLAILTPADTAAARNPHMARLDSMPGRDCVKLRINRLPGGSLRRAFADSNYLHLQAAEVIGIQPLTGPRSAWQAGAKLTRIATCEDFYLDDLTHSVPYLVPEARQLLHDIGRAFRDTLRARGGGDYRVKVTSVLRTPTLVKQLRRRNRNSVDSSAHLYGTTFDISHAQFICNRQGGPYRTQEDLKNLLGEIVWNERARGRCWVAYERKQSCFHITARPAGSPPPHDDFTNKQR